AQWNYLGLSCVYAVVGAYCLIRRRSASRPLEQQIQKARIQLTCDRDIVISNQGSQGLGTCWECGKNHAPSRAFRLARIVVLPIAAGGESVTIPIPLCVEHSDHIHLLPRWTRILSGPLSFLIFLSPFIVLGDSFERYSRSFREGIMAASFVTAVALFVFLQ